MEQPDGALDFNAIIRNAKTLRTRHGRDAFRMRLAYRRLPSLLYRRFPNLRATRIPDEPRTSTPCRFGNRRYSRFGNLYTAKQIPRSTAPPTFRPEVWDADGTRPYQTISLRLGSFVALR